VRRNPIVAKCISASPARQKPAYSSRRLPTSLQEHVANGKLILTLDDTIRLALANNTDIHLNYSQVESAQNSLHRAYQPFDPFATASFSDTRTKSPTTTQIQGAPLLSSLTQVTSFGLLANISNRYEFSNSFQRQQAFHQRLF